ncbi:MerR family transcriptional regulator [Bacillus sp. AFS015802]|uniref:MerR family transcriptional regulator n=1 Tax=Bacillus sp. AFS015802 TaxID=2033486 RepID=UPI000BF471DA|nr:MerR family transcriptional regulator [Bacillus sp. AFS015802]PFA63172.1 MerR family transcriptional regulator [Bacillus sp. AFS015802]
MEYTVKKLGEIAGVSTRTIRYYDEIELLKPARTNSSGYRIYGQKEVDRLQQILFYKELGVGLDEIKDILDDPAFDATKALEEHREQLLTRRAQIDQLIENVDKTIGVKKGRCNMSDKEKFEGFKEKLVEDNEKTYGKEVREKYGDKRVDESNAKVMNMSQEDYEKVTGLEKEMKAVLAEAFQTGDPASDISQKAADLHKKWISFYWGHYSKEAHAGLAQMYVDDERFKAYYDAEQEGMAEFLRDAIYVYTGQNS